MDKRDIIKAHLLLNDVPVQVKANWIWAKGYERRVDSYVMFRQRFSLNRTLPKSILRISASSQYILYINGREIGRGPNPSSLGYHYLDTYSVSRYLSKGLNVVAVLAHNEFLGLHSQPKRSGGVIAQIEDGNGNTIIKTDRNWKIFVPGCWSSCAPRFFWAISFGEYFDSNTYPNNWQETNFNEKDWWRANINLELGKETLLHREIPLLCNKVLLIKSIKNCGRWELPRGIQGISFVGIAEEEKRSGIFYVTSYCYVPAKNVKAVAEVSCDDGFMLKVNGKVILKQCCDDAFRSWMYEERNELHELHHGHGFVKQESEAIWLHQGWNRVEMKINTCHRSWGFLLRFRDRYPGRTLHFIFSFHKDLDKPGWKLGKIGKPLRLSRKHSSPFLSGDNHWDGPTLTQWQRLYLYQKGIKDTVPCKVQPREFLTIDFGQEIVGYPLLGLKGAGGEVVDIAYGEGLTNDGSVKVCIIPRYGDRLILKPGYQSWQANSRRGFRYLQITLRSAGSPIVIQRVGAMTTSAAPKDNSGSFKCSDNLLNQIYEASKHTLRLCMQDHFIDCPTREWGQYPGDCLIESMQSFYIFGEYFLSRKGLRQFARIQTPDGHFRALCPSGTNHNLPDYCLVWVRWLYEHYYHTRDIELIQELLPVVQSLFRWFEKISNKYGLLENVDSKKWWLFLDHGPVDKRGIVTGFNAWYYLALLSAAYLAEEVMEIRLARRWRQQAKAVKRLVNLLLWSKKETCYVDCLVSGRKSDSISIQTNILAIYSGLADKKKCEYIMSKMYDSDGIEKYPLLTSETPYFKFYVLESFYKAGKPKWAFELMRRYWGKMLNIGATSWWEYFDENDPVIYGSQCHAWSGAPGVILPSKVLGIMPYFPGFSKVHIAPNVNGLEWAQGSVLTPKGKIHAEWFIKKSRMEMSIRLPDEKMLYKIDIPSRYKKEISLKINGKDISKQSHSYPKSFQ